MSTPKSWAEAYEQDAKEAENSRDAALQRGDTRSAEYLKDRAERSHKAADLARGSRGKK